ncbi:MAG: c-type cytochrome [Bacteroidetes bacterium]|nr:c-type cytochrome [Bacteroidota bacterium]
MKKALLVIIILISAFSFSFKFINEEPEPIPASKQRSGNAEAGYNYITTGDYVKSGVPLNMYNLALGKNKDNLLHRDSLNAGVRYDFNVVNADNGEKIVVPNCLQCHAEVFNGQLMIGLGNSTGDFTKDQKLNSKTLEKVVLTYLKLNKKKYEAAKEFVTVGQAIGDQLFTDVAGVNPADRLAALLIAHRDPNTLQWNDKASVDLPSEVIPSDVPAWWLLKKKNAMFYNGFGRGDFGRFLMGSSLLTITDTVHANDVDKHMNDVLAYINSIDPPKFPEPVNESLAAQGKILFENNCSSCHGTYGENGSYPNLLIPESIIGTDSMLNKSNYQYSDMVTWFNNSWFSKGDHPAKLVPYNGYIAPPLDGVWITAPYFHNGSVPTIEAVLNSKLRPAYWTRNFNATEYDYENLGWKYTSLNQPGNKYVYNTTLPGYGNYGHTFGDHLTDEERKAVIEYLKTL